MTDEAVNKEEKLARAVPFFGSGDPIPRDRDLTLEDDETPFKAVVRLLMRSWPYLQPQILGYWWVLGKGVQPSTTKFFGSHGYTTQYVPPLVTLFALLPPLLGMVPLVASGPLTAIPVLTAFIVIFTWVASGSSGIKQAIAGILLLLTLITANMTAIVFSEDMSLRIFFGVLTITCLLAWFVQVRLDSEGFSLRFRIGSHLLYYYGSSIVLNMAYMLLGLLLAEVINQSLLQNEALMPGLAAILGYEDLSAKATETLSDAQRMELRWAPVKLEFAFFLLLWPLELALLYYVLWIFQQVNQDLRLALVERWHQLAPQHHANRRIGDSIWRIQTDSEAVTDVLKILGELGLIAVNVASTLLVIAILSPIVGLIATIAVIPTLFLARWAMPRVRIRSLVQRMTNADLTSRVQESFKSIKLQKAYGAQAKAQTLFEGDSSIALNAEYRQARLELGMGAITDAYSQLFIILGLGLMALWAHQGQATFANELVALLGLSFTIWNLSAFQWGRERHELTVKLMGEALTMWSYAQQVAMGLKRVFDILDLKPTITENENAITFNKVKRSIDFHNVTFCYTPDEEVLRGVNLEIKAGNISAIVGPSGAGKSTLVSLLLRLSDPSSGRVSIDGEDLRNFSVSSLRQNISIALQENLLFGTTIRENILYATPTATEQALADAIKIACLDEVIDRLPQGLDTVLGDRGARLSTGQKQRLSIARAVIKDAPVLILDEPTSSLDAETEHRILENLHTWARDDAGAMRAIILITHRLSTIRRANRIIYLESGLIAEHGDHNTLMQIEGGRYRSFVAAESSTSSSSL